LSDVTQQSPFLHAIEALLGLKTTASVMREIRECMTAGLALRAKSGERKSASAEKQRRHGRRTPHHS